MKQTNKKFIFKNGFIKKIMILILIYIIYIDILYFKFDGNFINIIYLYK